MTALRVGEWAADKLEVLKVGCPSQKLAALLVQVLLVERTKFSKFYCLAKIFLIIHFSPTTKNEQTK